MWYKDVESYSVYTKDGHLQGLFFLDLYPRDGKYTHACCENIQNSCMIDGEHSVRFLLLRDVAPRSLHDLQLPAIDAAAAVDHHSRRRDDALPRVRPPHPRNVQQPAHLLLRLLLRRDRLRGDALAGGGWEER